MIVSKQGSCDDKTKTQPVGWVGLPRNLSFLCGLRYVAGLRTLLAFYNLKLDRVALLQAFVAFGLDRAVMNEHVGTVFTADESESFGIVEPLDRTFQSGHLQFLRTNSAEWTPLTKPQPGVRPSTSDHSVLLAMPMLEMDLLTAAEHPIVRYQ